jgi:rod shape-determining protein MreD
MVVVIILGFVRGSRAGTVAGFVAGLLFDFIGTMVIGPMALTLTLAGFVAGILKEHIFAGGWLLPVTVLGIGSLVAEGVYLLIITALGMPLNFFSALFTRAVPGALYSMLIATALFPLLTKFLKLGENTEVSTFKRVS